MKQPQSNVALVTHMMEYSHVGAIKQAFIIEAIMQYSKQMLEADPWPAHCMISQDAWRQCARECIESIENRV